MITIRIEPKSEGTHEACHARAFGLSGAKDMQYIDCHLSFSFYALIALLDKRHSDWTI
jgi:hypothetical protein